MTTPQIHRIVPDQDPAFPCWIYHPGTSKWVHFMTTGLTTGDWNKYGWTHWAPDQPLAPTVTPEATEHAELHAKVGAAISERLTELVSDSAAPAQGQTPRTDAVAVRGTSSAFPRASYFVDSDFARQLERELAEAKAELAELRKDRERLQRFAQIVWDARWGSGENEKHTEELNSMVGIAAEIRSGNFQSIDAARQQEGRG